MQKLWYNKPARFWEEALPLGNGRIGAMIYGGVDRERIELNEDSLWTGGLSDVKAYGIPENIDAVRQLLREGKYAEASQRTEAMMEPHDVQAYQLAGNLYLDFSADGACTDYERSLDLQSAVASSGFEKGGARFRRESFVSAPHQVMVIRLSADTPGQISFALSADSQMRHEVHAGGNDLTLIGACPLRNGTMKIPPMWEEGDRKGMRYVMKTRMLATGGAVSTQDASLRVVGADEVVVVIAIQTGFAAWNRGPSDDVVAMQKACDRVLNVAGDAGWETLKADHCGEYSDYYSRLNLDLGETDDRPTNEILEQCKGPADNTALANLVFNWRFRVCVGILYGLERDC